MYKLKPFLLKEIKKIENTTLIKIILAYSAIKIRANITLPYSILNPETSSDSPSAKSNGVRLVSAMQEINQIPTIGKNMKIFNQKKFNFIITNILSELLIDK